MKIYDLDRLVRDKNQNDLYNLFDPTFKLNTGFTLKTIVVGPEHVMRPDLVCNEAYKDIDEIDFLLNLNDIDNPLNIMENDEIQYASITAIEEYRIPIIDNVDARAKLLNSNKTTKKDNNRKKYVEENYLLPPTYLSEPEAAVKIENGQIVIG